MIWMFAIILAMIASTFCTTASDLDAVVVVFRHGDRTPVRPYQNDPYKNQSYWSADWGQLTNLGKTRHYQLGQYFRERYSDFLPSIYSGKDIAIQSTDVPRTLMSAEANLAGLYPPTGTDVWKDGFPWQPIPIHTIPEQLDAVLAAKKSCNAYNYYRAKLLKSEFFTNVSHVNHDLYAYLTKYSGETVTDLQHLEFLYNTLQIEQWNNLTVPQWATKVFPTKMKPWADLSFAINTFTSQLARLKTGPFFYQLIEYFHNRTNTAKDAQFYAPKFLMFSAHDTTIASLLNSMGAFQYHSPPYTATIIFELYKPKENFSYVNMFYKNTSEATPIELKNCQFNCDLNDFETYLRPITLSLKQWESECNAVILIENIWQFSLTITVLCLCLIGGIYFYKLSRTRARTRRNHYSQLPDEEDA